MHLYSRRLSATSLLHFTIGTKLIVIASFYLASCLVECLDACYGGHKLILGLARLYPECHSLGYKYFIFARHGILMSFWSTSASVSQPMT